MLELKNITKGYNIGGNYQLILKGININFRKCEFVSIFGSSGSGKTTLLNLIGGLDKYDGGDLIIEGTSTSKYTDRDWDSYRNYRVGFIFQTYNLIMHQTVLSNVEIALTLSGISKEERKKRAIDALTKVGLADQINKKPNQLSGGQMQRVAIARALVNDPEIILADEPTGALDSLTSIQIMDLLKEIAKDKLVIMVTHNPDLANRYSTRIIQLKDGIIIGDTNPYMEVVQTTSDKLIKRTSIALLTALGLSFNNLMTKKGRTILTAIAGSIGIIGIAIILALSNGVSNYAASFETKSLANYPLIFNKHYSKMDLSVFGDLLSSEGSQCSENKICSRDDIFDSSVTGRGLEKTNNLIEFKKYIDSNEEIKKYADDIEYNYSYIPQVYTKNYLRVNPNAVSQYSYDNYFEKIPNEKEKLEKDFELLAGKFPEKFDEIVLVISDDNLIDDSLLYSLDILDRKELEKEKKKVLDDDNYRVTTKEYSYDDFLNKEYKLILNTDYYKEENGSYIDYSTDTQYMHEKINNGLDIKIVGVLKRKTRANLYQGANLLYREDLLKYVIDEISKTSIYQKQTSNKEINVLTGEKFDNVNSKYEDVAEQLGIYNFEDPSLIYIFPKDYDSKEKIVKIIDSYNKDKENNNKKDLIINYSDELKELIGGFSSVIDVVSLVLICIAAISLVVSSIMIAIITYISVLERTKEIGILRAIGASKKDISNVFKAETIIEGALSGALGIVVSLFLIVIINFVLKGMLDVSNIASLPLSNILFLILLSILLNLFAGLIPSRIAAKKNPVEALRSE